MFGLSLCEPSVFGGSEPVRLSAVGPLGACDFALISTARQTRQTTLIKTRRSWVHGQTCKLANSDERVARGRLKVKDCILYSLLLLVPDTNLGRGWSCTLLQSFG